MTELRGLYAITPEQADGTRLLDQVAAALAGGCRWVQYRDKRHPMAERLARAHRLRALTRAAGARLVINDDLALCLQVGADGVHMGRDDGALAQARAILGPGKLLGASCYADLAAAQTAAAAGADIVAFGAMFPSPVKPDAVRASPGLLGAARAGAPAAVCAIGGITLDRAPALIAAGADLLAVITDLFSAPDITARARQYQCLFERISS